jgi:outer membrane cobalamin receptor
MKYLFSFFIFIWSVGIYAQEIVVIDSVSGLPVESVVVTSGSGKGSVTDENGGFSLKNFAKGDTLVFSRIAYQKKILDYETVKNLNVIKLLRATINRQGVTITSRQAGINDNSFKQEIKITEDERLKYVSVGDFLKNNSSLYIKDYGGEGSVKSVSSRGMSSENTLVLFNEARVNDLRTGIFDFNSLDINSVDKIEYYKSFDYDTPFSSPGGVIKLVTDSYNDSAKVSFHTKFNTDNLKSFGLLASAGVSGMIMRFNVERGWSANNYDYEFENKRHERGNAWLSKTFLSGNLSKAGGNYTVKLYSNYSFFNSGIPGFVATNNLSSSRASNRTISNLNILSGEYFFKSNFSALASVSYNYQSLLIDDPDGMIFYSNTKRESKLNDFSSTVKIKYSLENWNFTAGYERISASLSNITAFVSSSGIVDDISRNTNRFYAGVKKTFIHPVDYVKVFSITAVAAHEELSEKLPGEIKSNSSTYKIGLSLSPSIAPWMTMKGNYSRDFRSPTFNERYYSLLYSHYDLKGEKYEWYDAGADFDFDFYGTAQISVSYFNIKGSNKIIWIPTRMAMQLPRNVGIFQTQGFELSFYKEFFDGGVKLNASYNYNDSRNKTRASEQDLSYDKYIMYTPLHRINAGIEAELKPITFSVSTSYISERFYSTDNIYKLLPYFICDVSVRGSFFLAGRRNTLSVTAYNIANEDYFIIQSYPMPLRTFMLTYNLEII